MMGFSRQFLLVLAWMCLAVLGSAGDIQELVILQTADIHAHAERHGAGWLRLATAVKAARREAGSRPVLLLDCGDTILGSLTATVAHGQSDVAMLRHLAYDAWIPGNHEADAGTEVLQQVVDNLPIPILNGNLELSGKAFRAWLMLTKGKARIAVIGMNNPNLEQWLWGARYAGQRVRSALPLLERLLPEIQQQKPDLIVLAIHQGFQERSGNLSGEVDEIARRFPQIHLILGAHTHRPIPGRRLGDTYYVQPAAHGEYLARVRVKLDLDRHRPLSFESELIRTTDLNLDPQAQAILKPWLEPVAAMAARVVVNAPVAVPADGRPGMNCHLSEMICRAIAAATDADVVFHPCFSKSGWDRGPLTEADLFRAVPYDNTVGIALLTRADLAAILQEQWRYRSAPDLMNGVWGRHARLDRRTGEVLELEFPEGSERIAVAFNSYTIAGGGRRYPELRRRVRLPAAKLREFPVNSRELLRRYLKSEVCSWAPPELWLTAGKKLPALAEEAQTSP